MEKELRIMRLRDKVFIIWWVILIVAVLIAFGFYLGNRNKIEITEDPFIMVDAGDTVFTVDWPETTSIIFGDNVGKLTWEDGGKMRFEGNYYESAKIFFEYFLNYYIDEYIEAKVKERSKKIKFLEIITIDGEKEWIRLKR